MEHKISGLRKDTPSKTYENVNRSLRAESKLFNGNWTEFAGNTEPLNSFEKSLKLIVIDTLKSKEGVIQALLSNDVQQIRRALRCKWFFEDAVLPEFYVTDIFPKVSLSTRCKVINQLSKHMKYEEHAEKLFEFVRCHYGRSHSVALLPKCREEFITSYLNESASSFDYALWRRLLTRLAPKCPQIVFQILGTWCDNDSAFHEKLCKCNRLILYLASHYHDLFLAFFEKHYTSLSFLHFGDKLRRNLSPKLLDIIFKSEKELKRRMFNEGNLFRELDLQGKVNFLAKLVSPKKETSFSCWYLGVGKILPFIKLRSAYERAELLDAVFKKVFEDNLWEHPELWQPPMLELMPLEIREKCVFILSNDQKFANYKFKNTFVERSVADQLAYLLNCEISVPKLKDMIKRTPSADDRGILLEEMAKSCAINEDFQSLEDICNYVKNRHRNEDMTIIINFFNTIAHSFDTRKFNLSLWTVIDDLLTTCIANNSCPYHIYQIMIEKYIIFLLKNNSDPKTQISNLVKYLTLHEKNNFISNVRLPGAEILFRACYDELIRIMDDENTRQETIKYLCKVILGTMNEYNVWHKKNPILSKDLTRLIFHLDKLFEICNSEKLLCIQLQVLDDSYLKEKYSQKIFGKRYEANLMGVMKKDPNYIMENLQDVFQYLLNGNNKKFLQCINMSKKIFDFYNVSEEFKNVAAIEFRRNGNFMRKYHALLLYSHFANISEYEKLIQKYIPKNQGNDSVKSDDFIEIQKIVPRFIKNVKPGSENFYLIFKFLLGDFPKYALGSLDSACYNSPVQTVILILKEKSDFPISVKKAFLRNAAAVCTLQEKIKFCNEMWEKESHDSIRSVIFKRVFENFLDEPTDESFNAVNKCILESSETIIQARVDIKSMPPRYKNDYASALWQQAEGKTGNVQLKNKLIKEINLSDIELLSDELCEKIIKSGIFMDSQLELNHFTCLYLTSNSNSVKRRLDAVLNLMLERKQNPNSIVSFLNVLGRFSLEHPKHFHEIFQGIIMAWPKIFTKFELFDEFLTIKYYNAYHKSIINEDFRNVLNVTVKFAEELKKIIKDTDNVQEYLVIFRLTIQNFLKKIKEFNCPLDDIVMIRQLITPPERQLAIIGILLLPNENLKESEGGEVDEEISLDKRKNIEYIMWTLKNFEDDSVQVYYYRRFNLKKFKK